MICMLGLALLGGAKAESATFRVSLVIQESCTIDSSAGTEGRAEPNVACSHNVPYRIAVTPAEPAQSPIAPMPAEKMGQDGVRTITF
jgi:hypothetical protein